MKPHGGVGGLTSINALASGEGLGGEGVSNEGIGDSIGIICNNWCDLALHFEVWVGCSISPAVTTGQDGFNTFSHPMNCRDLSWDQGFGTRVVWGASAGEGVFGMPSSSASEMATPRKTSSSVKVKYHFVSSLSSHTSSANRQDSPPVGGLFCSAQYWSTLAYATVFSLQTSLISQLAKINLGSGMNFCLWRQGGAGGAWSVAISSFSSCS